jgi:hypothetical protein
LAESASGPSGQGGDELAPLLGPLTELIGVPSGQRASLSLPELLAHLEQLFHGRSVLVDEPVDGPGRSHGLSQRAYPTSRLGVPVLLEALREGVPRLGEPFGRRHEQFVDRPLDVLGLRHAGDSLPHRRGFLLRFEGALKLMA